MANITGTNGNDHLIGTSTRDLIDGLAGADLLQGQSGDDVLNGGHDNDTLEGGAGDDILNGDAGEDLLKGEDGDDTLKGGADNDMLYGGDDDDDLYGEDGDDLLVGGKGKDDLYGGSGKDVYRYTLGDGEDAVDVEKDAGGETRQDVLELKGMTPADVSLVRHRFPDDDLDGDTDDLEYYYSSSGLYVRFGARDQVVHVKNFFQGEAHQLDKITFDDGTVWDADAILAMQLNGSAYDDLVRGSDGDDVLSGQGGSDIIDGKAGDDVLSGGKGYDKLYGGSGADVYLYAPGDSTNWVYAYTDGEERQDSIEFTSGIAPADVLVSREEDDLYLYVAGTSSTYDRNHIKVVDFFKGKEYQVSGVTFSDGTVWDADTLANLANNLTNTPTPHNDTLYGTDLNDVIDGLAGNDDIYGGKGNDLLEGGDGYDRLYGEDGDDTLSGGKKGDRLYGGPGDDILDGGEGSDHLQGGPGDDVYRYVPANNGTNWIDAYASGEERRDSIELASGIAPSDVAGSRIGDDLYLSKKGTSEYPLIIVGFFKGKEYQVSDVTFSDGTIWDADALTLFQYSSPTSGDDRLYGTDGDDTIDGLAGDDSIYGGAGNDILTGSEGNDLLSGQADNDTLYGNNGGDRLYGGDGNDALYGGDNRYLYGTPNSYDRLYGGAGDDLLVGGKGADYLYGGPGKDVYRYTYGDGRDVVDVRKDSLGEARQDILELKNITPAETSAIRFTGSDSSLYLRFKSSGQEVKILNFFLGEQDQIEKVTFEDGTIWSVDDLLSHAELHGTIRSETLSGSNGDDVIYGLEGSDVIYGRAGNDILKGGQDYDILYGEEGNDILYSGDVFNEAGVSGELYGGGIDILYGGSLYDELYGGSGKDILYGSAFYDKLYGGSGKDRLYGGDGGDRMYGGSSSDYLNGGTGDDIIYGQNGADALYGESGKDRLYGGEGADVIYGGSGKDRLYGGEGNDRIYGGTSSDYLHGGDQDDRLYGENGVDSLNGGAGDDLLVGGRHKDVLYGGDGDDIFAYLLTSDSSSALGVDEIRDFAEGDAIDVSALGIGGMSELTVTALGGDIFEVEHNLSDFALNITAAVAPDADDFWFFSVAT